jgi:hypothetical protein
MARIEYDELRSLTQSSNHEVSGLAAILENLKDRLEAIEKRQNELLDEVHKLKHQKHEQDSSRPMTRRRSFLRYTAKNDRLLDYSGTCGSFAGLPFLAPSTFTGRVGSCLSSGGSAFMMFFSAVFFVSSVRPFGF